MSNRYIEHGKHSTPPPPTREEHHYYHQQTNTSTHQHSKLTGLATLLLLSLHQQAHPPSSSSSSSYLQYITVWGKEATASVAKQSHDPTTCLARVALTTSHLPTSHQTSDRRLQGLPVTNVCMDLGQSDSGAVLMYTTTTSQTGSLIN